MNTPRRSLTLLACTMLMAGCATKGEPVPVAVSCPKPPPVPSILTEPVSVEPPLIVDWQKLMDSYRTALQKSFSEAIRP